MLKRICWIALVSACISFARGEVVNLTDSNFDDLVLKGGRVHGTWFIQFYADWCGQCKMFAPVWTRLEVLQRHAKSSTNFAKVNCMDAPVLAHRFEIKSYPTLLLLSKDGVRRYSGGRAEEPVRHWLDGGHQRVKAHPLPAQPWFLNRVVARTLAWIISTERQVANSKTVKNGLNQLRSMLIRNQLVSNRHINAILVVGIFVVLVLGSIYLVLAGPVLMRKLFKERKEKKEA
mmetsp:Transcript_31682/g.58189  ORF Transcript_31682/g.58189 Transcript_31682/m.58189 type:complete len:232 (+) Transcript_31682:99-794(+)